MSKSNGEKITDHLLSLRRNGGKALVPSDTSGEFSSRIKGCDNFTDGLDVNSLGGAMAFFSEEGTKKYESVIGRLPYVKGDGIDPGLRKVLPAIGDKRSNLYFFYISKCLDLMKQGGELLIWSSSSFLKSTSASEINARLFKEGSITHFFEMDGDAYFQGEHRKTAIWRWEKGEYSRKTVTVDGEKQFVCSGGVLHFFNWGESRKRLGDFFEVRVGAISGANEIFEHDGEASVEFVCSSTCKTGKTRRMVWSPDRPTEHLMGHKDALLKRRVARFNEQNWWHWGRSDFITDKPRIYVNERTRSKAPFFVSDCNRYDSSVLAMFPKDLSMDIRDVASKLNGVDWEELGFLDDGRFVFSQRTLEEALMSSRDLNF